MKVIYVSVVRLTDKMAADWHIDYLIERGVTVEYWDIVSLVREEHSERGALNPAWLHCLRSFDELETKLLLPDNRDAFYVMLLSYAGRLTRVFRLLSKHDCRMLQFAAGSLPRDPAYKWRKIAAWVTSPHRLAGEIFSRLKASALRGLKLVKPFTITFAAGDLAVNGDSYAARVVPINFFDYDYYLKAKRRGGGPLVKGRYAVFLDSNLPYHSDLTFVGYQHIDSAPYYRSLNRFFALLERAYGIKVVIAAHPRADYDAATFEGREMHRLVTAELVRDAEFVLSHTSTSMSLAVLNSKPIIFIYTAGMAAAYAHSYLRQMHCFADCLGAPIYNVDAITDARMVCVERVNATLYERYKYDFLTSHASENTSTEEIVWRAIHAQ